MGRSRALRGEAPPEVIVGAVLSLMLTGDHGRLSASAAALRQLVQLELPTSASVGTRLFIGSGLGVPTAGISGGGRPDAALVQLEDGCHQLLVPLSGLTKPLSGHRGSA